LALPGGVWGEGSPQEGGLGGQVPPEWGVRGVIPPNYRALLTVSMILSTEGST
jgi:hypothetical protein